MLPKQATLAALPPEYPTDLMPQIAERVRYEHCKLVVLDDDPTGTQTVYDTPVLTVWSVEALVAELRDPAPLLYILTNTRSLTRERAEARIREIMVNLRAAQDQTGRCYLIISRSDSTLRGHFVAELEAVQAELPYPIDGIIVVPFFLAGGRYTIGDTHYVAEKDMLVPAAQTEFARDAYFGYTESNLPAWIREQHAPDQLVHPVFSVPIEELRSGDIEGLGWWLNEVKSAQYVIVNAASERDLEVFVAAQLIAERHGKVFLVRSAASYVRVRAGLPARDPLTARALQTAMQAEPPGPGLIIAGSYVSKSSAQIAAAQALPDLVSVEIDATALLDENARGDAIISAVETLDNALEHGKDALLYTSRALIKSDVQDDNLHIGERISTALVEICQQLHTRPRWIIAKGGITSSDIATKALNIQRATVLGQLLPGVPVWQTGAESRFPGLIYVIFPGNVGDEHAMARAIRKLRGIEDQTS